MNRHVRTAAAEAGQKKCAYLVEGGGAGGEVLIGDGFAACLALHAIPEPLPEGPRVEHGLRRGKGLGHHHHQGGLRVEPPRGLACSGPNKGQGVGTTRDGASRKDAPGECSQKKSKPRAKKKPCGALFACSPHPRKVHGVDVGEELEGATLRRRRAAAVRAQRLEEELGPEVGPADAHGHHCGQLFARGPEPGPVAHLAAEGLESRRRMGLSDRKQEDSPGQPTQAHQFYSRGSGARETTS